MNLTSLPAALLSLCAALTLFPASAETIYLYESKDGVRRLVRLDSAAPGTLSTVTLAALPGSDTSLFGIDFNPNDGFLYGRSTDGGLNGTTVRLDPVTGAVTALGSSTANGGGSFYGFDFDPVSGQYRLVSDAGNSRRFNADGSAGPVDPALTAGSAITHIAYSNNVAGAAFTTLYGINTSADALVSIDSATGSVTTLGSLGVNAPSFGGFDISGATGAAYAVFHTGNSSGLYTINLATGAATLLGAIGGGTGFYDGLTVALAPPPSTPVPEPSTLAGLTLGLAALTLARRRR